MYIVVFWHWCPFDSNVPVPNPEILKNYALVCVFMVQVRKLQEARNSGHCRQSLSFKG